MGISRRKNGETPEAGTNEVSYLSVTTKELTMKSLAKTCSEYTIFKFDDKDVRIVAKDGEPWFLASDLCDVLGLDATSIRKLDDDEKGLHSMQTLGGGQQMAIISESGMWTLILRCRDAVKQGTVPYRVRKWVTAEVLPSIRKTGSYGKTQKAKKSPPGKITPDQQEAIKQLVMNRGKALPKEKQAKAMITMWSALKSHFGVSYKEIAEEQFTEALSLAARVTLEGEFIPREGLTIDGEQFNHPVAMPTIDATIADFPIGTRCLLRVDETGTHLSPVDINGKGLADIKAIRAIQRDAMLLSQALDEMKHRMMALSGEFSLDKLDKPLLQ